MPESVEKVKNRIRALTAFEPQVDAEAAGSVFEKFSSIPEKSGDNKDNEGIRLGFRAKTLRSFASSAAQRELLQNIKKNISQT